MNTKDILDKVLFFIQELTQFYGELSQELPDLRVVVDNTRNYSDVKKRRRKNTLLSGCGEGGQGQGRRHRLLFYR